MSTFIRWVLMQRVLMQRFRKRPIMKASRYVAVLVLVLFVHSVAPAHPGNGIAVDSKGQVFFLSNRRKTTHFRIQLGPRRVMPLPGGEVLPRTRGSEVLGCGHQRNVFRIVDGWIAE